MKLLSTAIWISFGTALLFGDTITPLNFNTTISVGSTGTINRTVTVSQRLSAPLDVFFLTDTTGSMGGSISSIRTGFSSIVGSLSGVAADAAFGAGEYKDIFDAFTYRTNQDIINNPTAVLTGINQWTASGGGDLPEANLFGLQQAASTASWRPGSQRFLIWAGDAPGHDPRAGATEASAIAALNAQGITVYSVSATSGPGIDQTGQASRISAATGGAFLGTFNPTQVATQIQNALVSAINNYSTVELRVRGLPEGVSAFFTPSARTGTFDRSVERVFFFDYTFSGLAPGDYTYAIDALVDGRVVATGADRIIVTGDTEIPEPSTYALLGIGLLSLGWLRRRG